MQYESAPKSLFKNASARKQFLENITQSFKDAWGHVELIQIYEYHEPFFDQLMANGEEYDLMTLDIINGRYEGYHERIDESRQWVQKILQEYEERQLAE